MAEKTNSVTEIVGHILETKDWEKELSKYHNKNREESLKVELVSVEYINPGYCIDERPYCSELSLSLMSSVVGWASGFVMYFLLVGNNLEQSITNTNKLYDDMHWGKMYIHIDDDHGNIKDPSILKARTEGCGFLGLFQKVAQESGKLLKNLSILQHFDSSNIPQGSEVFNELVKLGAEIICLTWKHQLPNEDQGASFVIIDKQNMTVDRNKCYKNGHPAFVWTRWLTVNSDVLKKFNQIAETELTIDQFKKMQTIVHLVTGLMLRALNLNITNPFQSNLVILK